MAHDKLIDSAKLDGAMTATADAIRGKTGKTADIPWDESTGFASEIASIQTTPDAVEQATPTITVSSKGLITASATQTEGYVAAGTKSATKQLTTQAAKTVTPSTSNQTAVASGRYTTGAVTVKGDANLKAANIAKGVSIFGVAGSLEGTKVATGTFELTDDKNLFEGLTLAVNGIPFKPTRVVWFYTGLNNSNGGWAGNYIYSFDSESLKANGVIDDGYEDEDTGEWEDYYCWWHHRVYNTETGSSPWEELLYTPLSDGFSLGLNHNTMNDEKYDLRLARGLYTYIAIG